MALIHRIRSKVRDEQYEFAIPHFFEEMTEDELTFSDIERAIHNGRIRRLLFITTYLWEAEDER